MYIRSVTSVEMCMWFIRFNLGGNEKEKTTVRIFPDEIVLGNLVIMRSSVHLCQRKFFNKHLRFPLHDLHVFVRPPLVSKIYEPCFCHVRTSPVSLKESLVSHLYKMWSDSVSHSSPFCPIPYRFVMFPWSLCPQGPRVNMGITHSQAQDQRLLPGVFRPLDRHQRVY